MDLNLSKKKAVEIVEVTLSKNGFSKQVEAKVNIVLDGSHSMSDLYRNGTVNALVNRALAVGYKFDDDGTIDVFDFSDGNNHRQLKPAKQSDYGSYNPRMLGGGTAYGPVLNRVASYYYDDEVTTKVTKTGGFLGMFKKETREQVTKCPAGREDRNDKHPVFTIFITDGETLQRARDYDIIKKLTKEHPDMFLMFVGIGREKFCFLKNLAIELDNVDFYNAGDLSQGDEALFSGILSPKAKKVLQG